MINPITFDSQMAMAGAMSSIFASRGGYVNESVEADNVGECDATEQAPVTEGKKESKKEQKSINSIVSKFHKDFAAKKFGKNHKELKTCKCGVCECGDQQSVGEGVVGAGVGAGLGACIGGPVGAVAGGALGQAVTGESEDEDGAQKAKKPERKTPVAPNGVEPETAADGEVVDGGEEPDQEVVAHASAVSERIASMRDKLVAELDADDGLELGTQKAAKQGEEQTEEAPAEDSVEA